MKAINRLRAIVRNLRRDIQAYREITSYQSREIAALRKQLADIRASKESDLDNVINRLHATAKALSDTAQREKDTVSLRYGTPSI